MLPSHTIKVAVYLVTMVAAETGLEAPCNFRDPDAEWEDMVDRILSKLPESRQIYLNSTWIQEIIDYFLILRLDNITVSGFTNLIRDGDVRPYCSERMPFIEVVVRSTASMRLDIPFE